MIATLAQLVERYFCKVDVVGSNPSGGSTNAGVAKRTNAFDCKSNGLAPSGVRIPPPAPNLRALGTLELFIMLVLAVLPCISHTKTITGGKLWKDEKELNH